MPLRVRPSPQPCLLDFLESRPVGITRTEAAGHCGITYWAARYYLDKKVVEGKARVERIWTIRHFVRRVIYYPVIKLREMVDITIVIYSVCVGKKGQYKFRFQGFVDIDALRDVETGIIDYDAELTIKEIAEAMFDFRQRWGWKLYGTPSPGTEEPVWVETSSFERITEPRGASLKFLSKVEEGEEVYFAQFLEHIYRPSEEEIEKFKRYGGIR
jgi:hypothetical protein